MKLSVKFRERRPSDGAAVSSTLSNLAASDGLGNQQIPGHDDNVYNDLARSAKNRTLQRRGASTRFEHISGSNKYFLVTDFSALKEIVSV